MKIYPELLKLLPPHSIDLTAKEWPWACWFDHRPQERPEPRPFELQRALMHLNQVKVAPYINRPEWAKAKIPPALSREEAHFWFVAMTTFSPQELVKNGIGQNAIQALTERLASQNFTGALSAADVREGLAHAGDWIEPCLIIPLTHLFTPLEWVELILLEKDKISLSHLAQGAYNYHTNSLQMAEHSRTHLLDTLCTGFRDYVWPFLSEVELETLRQRLKPHLEPDAWPHNRELYRLATCLKLPTQIERLVQSWPDEVFRTNYGHQLRYFRAQEFIFSLASPQQVAAEARRLKLQLLSAADVRAFLLLTGYEALDLVRDSILALQEKKEAEALLKVFSLVHAPEAAPAMVALKKAARAPRLARQWLDDHPEQSIAGLIPPIAAGDSLSEAALGVLNRLWRMGHSDFIKRCLAYAPPEAAGKIEAELLAANAASTYEPFSEPTTPDWLRSLSKKAGSSKAGEWVAPALLPPVVIGQYRLNEAQTQGLLALLRQSDLTQPRPALLEQLKAQAERRSLDAFAWELFELWLEDGAPSKEKWAMGAIGLLGSDSLAFKLAPLIRAWPGESQHQRAIFGLECLQAMGSDTALMQINSIAQKVKFKALKAAAAQAMEAIAQARQLSREQLEDRIVPDCGLDERGQRRFDYGARQFHFSLGPEMKPMIRDESGKLRPDLPKPGAKDDPALAQEALAEWKLLKQQVREVAKIQALRLEQAMVTGRRWSLETFETLLVRHPLLTHLVRRLLWAGYGPDGQRLAAFRVTEDQAYADVQDEALSLAGFQEIGLLHPLHLSEEERAGWGEIFADYELIPPFPQLGREIYRLEPDEAAGTEILRYAHLKIPAVALVGTLEKLGWQRGIPADAGIFSEHTKPFYGGKVMAVVQYYGVPVGHMVDWGDQSLERCFFVPCGYTPTMYPKHETRLALAQLDPVVTSETLRELAIVASKAR